MKKGEKGFAEVVVLAWVIAGLVLLFVPNPVSKAVGMGIQPNKTVERVELIKDKEGMPIAYKTTITDEQQRITLWQQIKALPVIWILLMIAGLFCTPIAALMAWINNGLKKGLKQVVVGVEEAKKLLPVEDVKILDSSLSKKMDTGIKTAVKKIKVNNW